jgi:3-deoxy-manno-octulosonate cytidylyltransferase (CMP-KDO synthetase)
MANRRAVAVIPSRYASTRFPGKPLALLDGRPMVAHVVERTREAGCFAEVLVAADDERVAAAARAAGATPVMTGAARTGTDRVAEAVREVAADVVVNVQGDEPAVPPASLRTLATFLLDHPEVPLATLALPAANTDLLDPNVVKVVCGASGDALYFSRSPIPYPRNPETGVARRHVGLYGFQRAALLAFASWPEAVLERVEGLEQLRALANGMAIRVLDAAGDSVAVDTPDDLPRAEAALRALRAGGAR